MPIPKLKSLAVAALLALALPVPSFGQTLAERVPSDALVYIGWKGTLALQPEYEKSNLKGVVDATVIPAFIAEKFAELSESAKANPEAEAAMKRALAIAGKMWKYPSAMYVGPVDLTDIEKPGPRLALICQAGGDADALLADIQKFLDMAKDAPVPITAEKAGDCVLVTLGKLTAQELAALQPGVVDQSTVISLNQKGEFKAALAQVDKDAAITLYVDVAAATKLGETAIAKIPEKDVQTFGPKIIDALGVKGVSQFVMTSSFSGREWSDRAFIGMSGPRKGILTLLDAPPIGDEALKAIPRDAISFQAMRLDGGKILTELRRGITSVNATAGSDFDKVLADFKKELRFDLSDDLLRPLGDEWIIYRLPQTPEMPIGFVLVNTLRDEKTAAATLAILEARLKDSPLPPIEKTKLADVDASVLSFGKISLAYGIVGGKLIVATTPGFEAAAAQITKKGPSILDKPSFIAVRKTLGAPAGLAMDYNEPAKLYPEIIQQITPLFFLARMSGVNLPADLLPDPAKVEEFLTPGGGASWLDAQGFHATSRSAFPGSQLMSGQFGGPVMIGGAAMGTAVLLPSLGRARELANRSYDAANLRGLGVSCIIWSTDHDEKMPEHFAQLVAADFVSPKQLVSKRSGSVAATVTAEDKEVAKTDWKKLAEKLEEHCDYVYLGNGTKNTSDSSQILAFEKASPGARDGVTLVFYDGHAEFVRYPALETSFAETNKAREKLKLPLVTFKDGKPLPIK